MRAIRPALLAFLLVAAACSEEPGSDSTSTSPTAGTTSSLAPTATTSTSSPSTSRPPTSTPAPSGTSEPPTTAGTTLPPQGLALALEEVASGFTQPVLVASPPGDERLFVVDQPGVIWVVAGGQVTEFLDISDDVIFQGEQGLLGLAFHPDYRDNGLFYVNYVGTGRITRIVEFSVSDDPNRADEGTARAVLEIPQPAGNHNGGMVAFGPDGNLWIGMGDGGGAGDRFDQGQDPGTLLGSMLRISVGPGEPGPYAVPGDNPFVDGGGLPEVWAIGLRNPWRFAFDGDLLYIADVGQGDVEEIDVVSSTSPGLNFGWPILEGDRCFRSSPCDDPGLAAPVFTYRHAEGCSVTGGFVYRGSAIPEIAGHYFFGDFCQGWLRSIQVDGDPETGLVVARSREWLPQGALSGLTSFGVDVSGELYVTLTDGRVLRIVRG